MDVIHDRVAGLDVSKADVKVCVRTPGRRRGQRHTEVRTFDTTTAGLLAAREWLEQQQVTKIAMEATGDYWRSPFYLLEGLCDLDLVNAAQVKAMPGRKTDVTDAMWLAQLTECGLTRSSFVPPEPIRQLRDLTRYRSALVAEQTREKNRLEKELEDAGIKLSLVATDIFGVSGRLMLDALIAGERDPQALAELAKGRLRPKRDALQRAMLGRFNQHHAFLCRMHPDRIDQITRDVDELSRRISEVMAPFHPTITLLTTVPGINTQLAEVITAEIGADMTVFPTPAQLCSWAGVAPGNHQSGPRRKRAKTTPGDSWLRAALGVAAMSATRTNNTYLAATYRRYLRRMPKLKALVALQHSMLHAIWHMITNNKPYQDLGADHHHTRRDPTRVVQQALRTLNACGYTATLHPIAAA